MPNDSIYDWSLTPADNATADATAPFPEFMPPSGVNDGIRAIMARIKQLLTDIAPTRTSTGSANAYTVASNAAGSAYVDGETLTFIPHASNTSACTLNSASRGFKPWRPAPGVEFSANSILAGVPVTAYYRASTDEFLSPGTGYYVNALASGVALQSITARLPQIGDLVVSFNPSPGPGRIRLTEATQALVKSDYPELDAWLAARSYPWGSDATHFNLPPAAGYFLRFAATSTAVDTSGARTAGSTQADQNKAHTHSVSGTTSSDGAHTHTVPITTSNFVNGGGATLERIISGGPTTTSSSGAHTHSVTGTAATDGGDEVRVKNVAFYCDVVASTALAAAQVAVFGHPYQWDTGTSVANPGAGRVRVDNANPTLATTLIVSTTDGWGVDLSAWLASRQPGAIIELSKVGAQVNRLTLTVLSTGTAGTGYVAIPVTVGISGGSFSANDQLALEFGSAGIGTGYAATSTTSLQNAGSGSKAFVTQAGLAYSTGARVRATSVSTGHWMEGLVTSYSGSTLTATMDASDGDTGTYNDWNINVSGVRGVQGVPGVGPGYRFAFETSTAMGAPANGGMRLNNGSFNSVTAIAIATTTAESGNPSIAASIATWDQSSTLAHRGRLLIKKFTAPENFVEFDITGSSVNNSTWYQLAVAYVSGSGSFSAADQLSVEWRRTGDAGSNGLGSGTVTSVDLSMPGEFSVVGGPVTIAGTFSVSKASQSANLVWASPNGGSGAPVFRALVAADIPALSYAPPTSGSSMLKGNGSGGFSSAVSGTDYQAPIGTISGVAKGNGANALTAATAGTDYVKPDTKANLTAGITSTPNGLGTVSSGTLTLDPEAGNYAVVINGGAFTIEPPATGTKRGGMELEMINGPGAGTPTLSPSKWATAAGSTGATFTTTAKSTATATITIASPGVVSWTAHGLADGSPVYFTTTGALPTGLTASTVYYVKYVDANTFQLSATPGGSAIDTTGSQSGTHTATACSVWILAVRIGFAGATYMWAQKQ